MQSYALEMFNITNKTDSSLFKALKMKFKIYVGAIWQESKLVCVKLRSLECISFSWTFKKALIMAIGLQLEG